MCLCRWLCLPGYICAYCTATHAKTLPVSNSFLRRFTFCYVLRAFARHTSAYMHMYTHILSTPDFMVGVPHALRIHFVFWSLGGPWVFNTWVFHMYAYADTCMFAYAVLAAAHEIAMQASIRLPASAWGAVDYAVGNCDTTTILVLVFTHFQLGRGKKRLCARFSVLLTSLIQTSAGHCVTNDAVPSSEFLSTCTRLLSTCLFDYTFC